MCRPASRGEGGSVLNVVAAAIGLRASPSAGRRPGARREAEVADEGARHVTLIREPAVCGNVGQAAAGADQDSRTLTADLSLPFGWRHPVDLLKSPQQLVSGLANDRRPLGQ